MISARIRYRVKTMSFLYVASCHRQNIKYLEYKNKAISISFYSFISQVSVIKLTTHIHVFIGFLSNKATPQNLNTK